MPTILAPIPACRAAVGLLLLALLMPGCASLSPVESTYAIRTDEMATHVDYLASPALAGRTPRSSGSRDARRYIMHHFNAYGLKPWGETNDYEQSFIIGTNVIGVLPGSDPDLAHEFVVLSAHYDHVGMHKGEMHLGAADNASGVAVLLEVAEQLAASQHRPRRSIVFAAFDAEEIGLLGSFAFTAREDFQPGQLAGVVNLDMLGRQFLDVVDNGLIAFGTENYPQLREALTDAGERAGINILPMGRDMVGPRSDHAAFETFGRPWVFLTSGEYSDYHKPTDTPDKLDYEAMRRAGKVTADALLSLANAERVEPYTLPEAGDRAELATVLTVLDQVLANPEQARIQAKYLDQLRSLRERVDALLAQPTYRAAEREAFAALMAQTALPIMLRGGGGSQQHQDMLLMMRDLYRHSPELVIDSRRDLMRHIMRHRPGVFRGAPTFEYRRLSVNDRTVRINPTTDGRRMRLSASVPRVEATVDIGWFGKVEHSIRTALPIVADCTGTPDELVDYVLLRWSIAPGRDADETWPYALRRLTGHDAGESYDNWLNWRLAQTAHGDAQAWCLALLDTAHPQLRTEAMDLALWRYRDAAIPGVVRLITDRLAPAPLRGKAIASLRLTDGLEVIAALKAVLDDTTPLDHAQANPALDPTFPFYHDSHARVIRRRISQEQQQDAPAPTLADEARKRLGAMVGDRDLPTSPDDSLANAAEIGLPG